MTTYYPTTPEGAATIFNSTHPVMEGRSGVQVEILRRIEKPEDDERYRNAPPEFFPVYTIVFPDGFLWDADPEELSGDRPGLTLCPRCDVREVPETAPGRSRTDNATAVCSRCDTAEAMEDMLGELRPQSSWPIPRYSTT